MITAITRPAEAHAVGPATVAGTGHRSTNANGASPPGGAPFAHTERATGAGSDR
ncbi:hypothetical protein LX15_002710 [Streptoalloteichus tenebrarius]|uniref:Uncharacterized protein n=1 Tax=Streptoalloteichus tenebrarius (strain ATCC 17920 / DSM 40477 / JCM 4838 / CBS 697.72 / NBRC 16177 / NCIMB 11028 / NRRL B-12390 / A12253. 1 / ISP 5477) TaxID=1933 RepID=A0ABT1HU38_STRSD|nr:hypothetical protein [Streptoalloteichus tenebrarius]